MKAAITTDNGSLLKGCIRGDKEALGLFYTRFAPRMLGVIRRYVSDPAAADDILHDGFIVGMTRLGQLKDPEQMERWLATIMRNLSLQYLHTQDITTVLDELPEMEDTPDIDTLIDLDTLEALIQKLPAGYQKVFRLAVLENKSHKEIGKLLGIAPNTSSSQLFHAKQMMRMLITEYRRQAGAFVLVALAIGGGMTLMWNNHPADISEGEIAEVSEKIKSEDMSHQPKIPQTFVASASVVVKPSLPVDPVARHDEKHEATSGRQDMMIDDTAPAEPRDSIVMESGKDVTDDKVVPNRADSVDPRQQTDDSYGYELTADMSVSSGWSVGIGVNSGMLGFISGGQDDEYMNEVMPPTPLPDDDDKPKPGDNSGGDVPSNTDDGLGNGTMMRKAGRKFAGYRSCAREDYLPVTVSATVKKRLIGTLGVETGLTYNYLHSKFVSGNTESHCHWHYLGVPLKLNVEALTTQRIRLNASAGAEFSTPLNSHADVTTTSGTPSLEAGRFTSYPVWSFSVGFGVSFRITDKVDLFIEPEIRYRLPHSYEVPNTWTDRRWGITLPIGVHLNL